jgi:hypothetical protein
METSKFSYSYDFGVQMLSDARTGGASRNKSNLYYYRLLKAIKEK